MAFYVAVVGVVSLMVPALAGATADPALTSATNQATSYFSANLVTVVGGFIVVTGVLWLLALAFNSMGLRRKRSI
jgi:hypothetical protein